jgi:hypothetical protein
LSQQNAGFAPIFVQAFKGAEPPADAHGMDPVSRAGTDDVMAVAVELKAREHMKALQEGMIKLIDGAGAPPEAKPLPPDATFSTYA